MKAILSALALLFAAGLAVAAPPQNLDFEAEAKEGVPGWFVPPVCEQAGWGARVVEEGAAHGKRCVELRREGDAKEAAGGFGNFMQSFDAETYRGKRLTISLRARLGEQATGRAQPWVRVDRAGGAMGFFDNCGTRPVTGSEWKTVSFAADIDDDAAGISIGLMVLGGDGPAYLDDVSIVVKEKPAVRAEPSRELSERGLANLVALTRAIGYVRHYYPSDEAAALNDSVGGVSGWDRFAVEAVGAVEGAASAEELAGALGRVFSPIAPAVMFQTKAFDQAFDLKWTVAADERAAATVVWRHRGFAPNANKQGAIYFSERVTKTLDAEADAELPKAGDVVERKCEVGGGAVFMRVPIVLYKDEKHTLPRPVAERTAMDAPPDLSASDRATRLAAVMLAWGVLQHHFPYFDVIRDDLGSWDAALSQALKSAATDADGAAFTRTLERLVAHLHDGHGNVWWAAGPERAMFSLPLLLTFVHGVDEPVVLNAVGDAPSQGVMPGCRVLAIGGKMVGELVADARAHEPAATDGFFHWRAARRFVRRDSSTPVSVKVQTPEGKEIEVELKPVTMDKLPAERSGPVVSEPKPGIWYVDLDRATDDDLKAAMPDLAKARGIVFDMRGYPNRFSMGMLGHLTTAAKPLKCAMWEIPMANWPDRDHMEWDHARWDLPALKPRIPASLSDETDAPARSARVAFITDGRAISAAETFLGIVEAYKLAEIVGEPTAGTNGNVNSVALPGGFSIMFTGMKVLKHDGSQHHGIGIRPTVEAHRTIAGIAAGRDEMVERAVEVVNREGRK